MFYRAQRATVSRRCRVLGAGVCLAIAVSTAIADDGSVETVGGAVRLIKDQGSIRMLSERVRALVSAEVVDVDCVFVLKNEGPADTVLVGFPDGAMGPYRGGGEEYELESFRSWVDGVEIKCRRVSDVTGVPTPEGGSWWIKRVVFPRGAVRSIRAVSPSWHPTIGTRDFQYVLWTGASWKGSIGSAEIVATLDGIPLDWVTGTDPEARRVGPTFRWSFRDFEPGSADGSPASVRIEWRVPGSRRVDEPDTLRRRRAPETDRDTYLSNRAHRLSEPVHLPEPRDQVVRPGSHSATITYATPSRSYGSAPAEPRRILQDLAAVADPKNALECV